MFQPTEIIFASTTACNLHCEHCFVNRIPQHLSIESAKAFILSCKNAPDSQIDKIGFSGGEPFLYSDFLLELTKFTVSQDLMFDQIMTNGDWWQTEQDLNQKLTDLYNAGYDGKIGLSWDTFHNQNPERMQTFISAIQNIFGTDSINIQTVIPYENTQGGGSLPLARTSLLATPSSGESLNQKAPQRPVKIYELPQTFPSTDKRAWSSKKWFKEDYCQGPGNIFYIHADGNIAPCCGFANENKELFIGKITDTYETVMNNAEKNPLIKICYETGLSKYKKQIKKQLKKQGKKLPGKTSDICSFCDFVCKNR